MPTARKYVEVLAFVAVWMAAGWIFRLDANAYLLLGVPLVALFQLFVRRQPLQSLCGSAMPHPFDLAWLGLDSQHFLSSPLDTIWWSPLPKSSGVVTLWLLCALAGAVFAAFALRQQHASATRRGLPGFIAAVLIGVAIMAASAHQSSLDRVSASQAVFLAEAVLALFCGVIRSGGGGFSWRSRFTRLSASKQWAGDWLALAFCDLCFGFVGYLALAHALLIPGAPAFAAAIPALIVVHTLVGVPLSFAGEPVAFYLTSSGPCSY